MKKLKQAHVRVDLPDGDTVLLRNVPSQRKLFNKPHTNLLIKRAHTGTPYLVCVDEDLEYCGADQSLLRAFTGGHKQQGWRVLFVEQNADADLQKVLERALDALGFDGREPVLSLNDERGGNGKRKSLLERFGKMISEECVTVEPTVGREIEVADVVSSLLQWQLKFTVIEGRAGVGKTNLLYGVARKLRTSLPNLQLFSVDLADLFAGTMFDAERENLFLTLLNEAVDAPLAVVAMEHLEVSLVGQVPRASFHLANALDRGAKLLGTTRSVRLIETSLPLGRTCVVELKELNRFETEEVLRVLRDRIMAQHQVRISGRIIPTVIDTARSLEGLFPAKAIALLDAAAARAALYGKDEVREQDLALASARFREDEDYPTLIAAES